MIFFSMPFKNLMETKFKKAAPSILFVVILFTLAANLIVLSNNSLARLWFGGFFVLLLIAKFKKMPTYLMYIVAGLSFIAVLAGFKIDKADFDYFSSTAFYFPMIYSILLTDNYSPIVVGALLIYTFTGYLGVEKDGAVIGNIIGIIVASVGFDALFYFVRRLSEERDRYKRISLTDSLTDLFNLGYVIDKGGKFIEEGTSVTAFIIDIDNFRHFNDTFGHIIGNKLLIQMANTIRREFQNLDSIIGRLGGDEYVVLVKNLSDVEADNLFKQLMQMLNSELFVFDPKLEPMSISCSIGMAHCSGENIIGVEDLLHRADENMYYNKQKNAGLILHTNVDKLKDEGFRRLLDILAEKDMYSYVHSQYVAQYSLLIAKTLNLPEDFANDVFVGAWLHDIGKIFVPNSILRKRGSLTDKEFSIIKQHPDKGLLIVSDLGLSDVVKNSINYHHERFDGSGYPKGTAGNNIPLEARIVQIADTFSAMTVKRVYRELSTIEEVMAEIKRSSGSQLDPELTKVFIDILEKQLMEENREQDETSPLTPYVEFNKLNRQVVKKPLV